MHHACAGPPKTLCTPWQKITCTHMHTGTHAAARASCVSLELRPSVLARWPRAKGFGELVTLFSNNLVDWYSCKICQSMRGTVTISSNEYCLRYIQAFSCSAAWGWYFACLKGHCTLVTAMRWNHQSPRRPYGPARYINYTYVRNASFEQATRSTSSTPKAVKNK